MSRVAFEYESGLNDVDEGVSSVGVIGCRVCVVWPYMLE